MEFPKFIEDAIGTRPIYQHLHQNETAKLQINFTVANFDATFFLERRASKNWSLDIHKVNESGVKKLDKDFGCFLDFDADAPLIWKQSVEHLSNLLSIFCVAIAKTAESPNELHKLDDCLGAMIEPFAREFFDTKLTSWLNPPEYRDAFTKVLDMMMEDRIELLVASCWDWYRRRLDYALENEMAGDTVNIPPISLPFAPEATSPIAAIPLTSETKSRSDARKSVVEPILNTKDWTVGRWGSEAGVGKNCPYDYLAGKRRLTPENRRALAEELGLSPHELPND